MLRELGWGRRKPVRSVAQAVAHCFIAALQTGMRAGELTGLVWGDVRSDYCTLHAGRTKTGKARQVPLTAAALRNLEALRGWDGDLVFGLKSQTLDAMFRKYRARAGWRVLPSMMPGTRPPRAWPRCCTCWICAKCLGGRARPGR